MKLLILYSEIAGYTLACLDQLLSQTDLQIRLIRWPVNAEAPFHFEFGDRVEVIDRGGLTQQALDHHMQAFAPDAIFTSGWIDKGYVKSLRYKPAGSPVICGLDNQWVGSMRQRVATWLSPWLVRRHFDFIWGAGPRQRAFARHLGYDDAHIREGYYSADVARFNQAYAQYHPHRSDGTPHLLYVGRLMAHKGIAELIEAFLRTDASSQWQMTLVGKPDGSITLPQDPRLHYLDFVQPKALPSIYGKAQAFALPSRAEPWGVALHEAAASGLPLIASDAVGAADAFLQPGENGFLHQAASVDSIDEALLRLMACDESMLRSMGDHSHQLAQRITPQTWAETLLDMIHQYQQSHAH
jgi:glycosyltransferase involved in cell wall biosynthesis